MALDRTSTLAGLWPGSWAAECGGPRRQKAANRGLGLGPGDRLVATTRDTREWNVMFVQRNRGELYLQGANDLGQPARGWVERLDPVSLDPLARSADLPAGGHTWCGAALVTAAGEILVVNGRFIHRLAWDSLGILGEYELAADAPHNGIVPLHDGAFLTKDLRLDQPSTITVVDGDLHVLGTTTMTEASMGRVAADHFADRTAIYLPGEHHVFRYWWVDGRLAIDDDWSPQYREPGCGGMAWDTCLAGDRVWMLDNGSIPAVQYIHGSRPTGSSPLPEQLEDSWREPVTLTALSTNDPSDVLTFTPFPDARSGWVIAPPTFEPGRSLAIVHDTGNAHLGAWHFDGTELRPLWEQPMWMWMQPLLFPETGELVINNYDEQGDNVAVLDLDTGTIKGQVPTGARRPNGMFLTPGWARDVYYASFDTIARVHVEAEE